jgi:RNA polymerase sigma factor (sigma-70 family)
MQPVAFSKGTASGGPPKDQPTVADLSLMNGEHVNLLLNRWYEGDDDAATCLYNECRSIVGRIVSHHLNPRLRRRVSADDMMQTVFMIMFTKTRRSRMNFASNRSFLRWLRTLASNVVLKRIKMETATKRGFCRETNLGDGIDLDDWPANSNPTDRSDRRSELRELIDITVAEFDAEHREIVRLTELGHSQQEIARRLGISVRTVRRRMGAIRDGFNRIVA